MRSTDAGFTLIELMIVIAIIGILAMIAVPLYEDYSIQAQVTEGTSLATGVETAFTERYDVSGTAAGSNSAAGITGAISGRYVQSVALTAPGQITVTFGNGVNSNVDNDSVIWTAYESPGGDIAWVCNDGASTTDAIKGPPALKPVGAAAINGTLSVPGGDGGYLPPICR